MSIWASVDDGGREAEGSPTEPSSWTPYKLGQVDVCGAEKQWELKHPQSDGNQTLHTTSFWVWLLLLKTTLNTCGSETRSGRCLLLNGRIVQSLAQAYILVYYLQDLGVSVLLANTILSSFSKHMIFIVCVVCRFMKIRLKRKSPSRLDLNVLVFPFSIMLSKAVCLALNKLPCIVINQQAVTSLRNDLIRQNAL